MTKCGLDKATAHKVVEFMKSNAGKVPGWLGQSSVVKDLASKVGLGGLLGGLGGGGDDKKPEKPEEKKP
ncbi:MAG: hypothetical protein IT370_26020 [Deltaproteobacteria bacterium]|nr:hypothetical protein [Deltaproteobacteria bacterium]